jgi:hypothetical protein
MKKTKTPERASRRAAPRGSADDRRFRWMAKKLPTVSYTEWGPEQGLCLEWTDDTGQHRVIQKTGIHAEHRMRQAIDLAMQNTRPDAGREKDRRHENS